MFISRLFSYLVNWELFSKKDIESVLEALALIAKSPISFCLVENENLA